ncbi:hypothetical protein Back11_33120 [Paenibacillus baekrokdamisoli]|uniref:Uncharacterized protein n=1 Tax=Paenibacillus baekrokdamisoli TaxID=1712516 RepID=A0A3G9ISY4_9BACL|nr:hypothetical protein [Paenibacillus baekrokdamisoli]MBB3071518.1 hypothetical protein [Paenibacillus baekrokdamisoli]BBH21967.1 hypothetical protein Back11_33120 [Paenibacillus baekrokdamisoli]
MKSNRLRVLALFLGLLVIILLFFLYIPPGNRVVADFVRNTRLEQYAKIIGVKIEKKYPPQPKVMAGTVDIPTTQSTYCWGKLGCADYAGGIIMVKNKIKAIVSPDTLIKIKYNYSTSPSKLTVTQLEENNKSILVQLSNNCFQAPKESGVYYYEISASWQTKGDTSSVFAIEVK